VRAAVITALTGPDAVEVRDVPDPVPQPGQVVVDVEFAAVVFPDVLQTRGEYQLRPELPFTPGWEVAGVVRKDAGGFRAGQRVAAMPVIGGFAEAVAVDADMVFPLPDEVPFEKGAALPLNYLTMHFALLRRAELKRGETVLVHGAAGGVGTAACQLAAAHGARVIAVVSTAEKGEVARAAGAQEIVSVDGFRDRVRGSPRVEVWTSLSTPSAATASPTRCAAWPARAGWSSSASPAGRSPRSRSIGCC
jgi:NADPH2:quinone reductase